MVQNLTDLAANASNLSGIIEPSTTSSFNVQSLAVTIAALGLLITAISIMYKFGQQVGEIKGIRDVVDTKLNSVDQRYNTNEKLQQFELNIRNKTEKGYVDDQISKLEDKIIKLNTEIEALKGKIGSDRMQYAEDSRFIANKFNKIESDIRDLKYPEDKNANLDGFVDEFKKLKNIEYFKKLATGEIKTDVSLQEQLEANLEAREKILKHSKFGIARSLMRTYENGISELLSQNSDMIKDEAYLKRESEHRKRFFELYNRFAKENL